MLSTKFCPLCLRERDLDKFYRWKRTGYYAPYCKECSNKKVKEYRASPKGRLWRKKYNLEKSYGITLEQWQEMYDLQEGCCKICKRHQSELDRTLFVDHDHKTGKVRGLLCSLCNQFLGRIDDDPTTLLEYLK